MTIYESTSHYSQFPDVRVMRIIVPEAHNNNVNVSVEWKREGVLWGCGLYRAECGMKCLEPKVQCMKPFLHIPTRFSHTKLAQTLTE